MENNPQLAQVLNDPAMMRQYLDMARNPEVNEREERAACVSCLRFVLRGGFRGGSVGGSITPSGSEPIYCLFGLVFRRCIR